MMMKPLLIALLVSGFSAILFAGPLTYQPDADMAKGKKLVFVASDHEYRSEETLPALARIMAKHHGFECVVVFGIDPNDGTIVAGQSNLPGIEHLDDADGMVIFTRFLAPPDEQMKHLDAYLNRGGPVVALRTSTHGFKYPNNSESAYRKYHFRNDDEAYYQGFGHQVQGQSWVGHYGKNHTQSTRIDIIPGKKEHPILRGVSKIWVECGGYNAEPQDDWDILTMAQPLMTMEPDGVADETKPPKASEWTRTYQNGPDGKEGRSFTSLYGASEDLRNDGYRRMLVNAIYWSLGMEDEIQPDFAIDFVGPYQPNTFSGRGQAKGIKPSAYEGFESPIPAHNETAGKR